MQSKVQTTDVETRHDFKARMADKVAQSLIPPVSLSIVEPVQVTIPVNFHTMSKSQLFGYLTHEKGLTPEQANDVVDILDGKGASFAYDIVLAGIRKEVEAEILPEPIPVKIIKVELPHNFNSLRVQDRFLWLMKESHLGLSHAEANDIIDILSGKPQVTRTSFALSYAPEPIAPVGISYSHSVVDEIPKPKLALTHFDVPEFPEGFELKTRVEQYRVLTDVLNKTPEHARFILDTLQIPEQEVIAPEPEPAIIYVSLPYAFHNWKSADQFAFLIKVKHLSTSDAQDVISHYDGRQSLSTVLMDWEDVADPEGRNQYKSKLANKIDNIKVKEPKPVFSEKKAVREETEPLENSPVPDPDPDPQIIYVSLPFAFRSWYTSDQFAFLTKEKQLSTEDAEDVLASWEGRQTLSTVLMDWEDVIDSEGRKEFKSQLFARIENAKVIEPEHKFNEKKARREIIEVPDISNFSPISDPEPITITLPIGFNEFKTFDQYLYLTRTLKLPIDDANKVIAGDPGFNISFAPIEEEGNG